MVLSEILRTESSEFEKLYLSHQFALLSRLGSDATRISDDINILFDNLKVLLMPWRSDERVSESTMVNLISKWEEIWGDMDSPETQEKVDLTIKALKDA